MKRAIEQLVLAPLAITIVTNNFPQGRQFLFVSEREGKLKVDFVDPEAPKTNWKKKAEQVKAQKVAAETTTLNQIIIRPLGKLSEREAIIREWKELDERVVSGKLDSVKDALMQQMAGANFWEDEERFDVLNSIEYLDRFQYSFTSLSSLIDRILDEDNPSLSYPADLLKSIAERLRLLKIAHTAFENHELQDCFLKIEVSDLDVEDELKREVLELQQNMYTNWAKIRRMHVKVIHSSTAEKSSVVLWFGGYGARQLLEDENGLHVWETKTESAENVQGKTKRARLRVVTYPYEGATNDNAALSAAYETLAATHQIRTQIVRTYKRGKKGFVKDHLKHWKTARIDFILKGNFDLM